MLQSPSGRQWYAEHGRGDATVLVPGAFGSDAGSLTPSAAILDPTRLDEVLRGHDDSKAAFAKVRSAAHKRTPPVAVDWTGAADYIESLKRPPRGLGSTSAGRTSVPSTETVCSRDRFGGSRAGRHPGPLG